MVERCCDSPAGWPAGWRTHPGIEIVNEVVLNQVLVAVGDGPTTTAVVERIQADGVLWLGATRFHGTPALRISVSGWNTTDEDADRSVAAIIAAVEAVRERASRTSLAPGGSSLTSSRRARSGRSRASRGAETIWSTMSRPLVTWPKRV